MKKRFFNHYIIFTSVTLEILKINTKNLNLMPALAIADFFRHFINFTQPMVNAGLTDASL
jgi:hypothetical protein